MGVAATLPELSESILSKVIRKHTKLNHNHPNCFTNDIICSS